VVRASSSSGEIRVDYGTVNGTASAGADYEGISGTLTFHSGEVSKTFSVFILDDSVAEVEKTAKLSLSNPTGGAVLDPARPLSIGMTTGRTPCGDLRPGHNDIQNRPSFV
jgi:hypothetical protein